MPVWDDRAWLLAFLHDRNAPCPRCGYNIRNLEDPRCPECGEALVLRVGRQVPKFGWLLLMIAPGAFSGVAAVLVGLRLLMFPVAIGVVPLPILLAEAFGVASAAATLGVYFVRGRILRREPVQQAVLAAAVWLVHIAAFLALIAYI